MSTSVNNKVVTETNLADGKLVEALENWELIPKLGRRPQKPVASKEVGQLFYLYKQLLHCFNNLNPKFLKIYLRERNRKLN